MFRLSGLRNGVRGLETRFGMNFDKLFTGIALRDTWTDFSVLDCVRHKTNNENCDFGAKETWFIWLLDGHFAMYCT